MAQSFVAIRASGITNSAVRLVPTERDESPNSVQSRPELLGLPLSQVDMSVRLHNCLMNAGCKTMRDVVRLCESDVFLIPNAGRKTAKEFVALLAAHGLRPGMSADEIAAPSAQTDADGTEHSARNPEPLTLRQRAQLARSINEFALSERVRNVCLNEGIHALGDIIAAGPANLLYAPNFGRKSLSELEDLLRRFDLHFELDLEDWRPETAGAWRTELADELAAIRAEEVAAATASQTGVTSLDQELQWLIARFGGKRGQLLAEHYGWTGGQPETLEQTGQRYRITRERVRQVCVKFERAVAAASPPVPCLDRAIGALIAAGSLPCDVAERHLIDQGITARRIDPAAVLTAAMVCKRQAQLSVSRTHGERWVCLAGDPFFLPRIVWKAKILTANRGCALVEDVADALSSRLHSVDVDLVRRVLSRHRDIDWLDDEHSWFWNTASPRNRLRRIIRKVLSVAGRIDVAELRAAVRRDSRMQGLAPPAAILLAFCQGLPFLRVDGRQIVAAVALDPETELKGNDLRLWRVMHVHGPLLRFDDLRVLAKVAGVNQNSVSAMMTNTPLIVRIARGLYSSIGAQVTPDMVEPLLVKEISRVDVLRDHGWTAEGEVWCAYTLSPASIRTGSVAVPSVIRGRVDGSYRAVIAGKAQRDSVTVAGAQIRGLQALLRRFGCEASDVMAVRFDRTRSLAHIEFGDDELITRYAHA